MSVPTIRLHEMTSPDDRMAELERFLEFWFGKRRPEYGVAPEVLDQWKLPAPLRRFHAFAGNWPSAEPERQELFFTGGAGHHLRALEACTVRDDGTIDFFMEYQGDWEGLTLQSSEDPPVWLNGFLEQGRDEERIQVCDSLSGFLITHCLMTILYECENAPCSIRAKRGPLVDRFHDRFGPAERIWEVKNWNWPTSVLDYRGQFYLIPYSGGILVHRDGDEYFFGALRPSAISIMVGDLLRGPHTL